MAHARVIPKMFFLFLLLSGVVGLQFAYDLAKPMGVAGGGGGLPPVMIRMIDLGFHGTVASFLWIPTMPEILDFFRGRTEYLADVTFVNAIDPKLSYPYAFSVLTLPAMPQRLFPGRVKAAEEFGLRGLAAADADWRIPYYMATNYYIELKDKKSAQRYYDIAARTPGVPAFAARFALNFGIGANEREKTKELWTTIRDSTNDEATKARAQAYIDRLALFDYLEAAAKAYKQKFGAYPASPDDLVAKKIIPAVPEDPFGFTFIINSDGSAGIDLNKLPGYLQAAPRQ